MIAKPGQMGRRGSVTTIVGARFDDDNDNSSGSSYLFDAAAPGKCPWDLDDNNIVGVKDLLIFLGNWG